MIFDIGKNASLAFGRRELNKQNQSESKIKRKQIRHRKQNEKIKKIRDPLLQRSPENTAIKYSIFVAMGTN